MQINDDDLAEWRGNPVTEAVLGALDRFLLAQEEACKAAAWEGRPWPDDRRQAVRLMLAMWWDAKQAPAEELNRMLNPESGEQ